MSTVSQEQADQLRADIEKNIPNFEILYKEDEDWYKQAWYLWIIWAFFRIVGIFSSSMRDRFDTQFCNGVYSKMVLTSREKHGDWTQPATYRLVVHEYRHMLDMKRRPIWMPLSYIFVLPALLTMRAHWELRGYTAEMLAFYTTHGTIPDMMIERFIRPFTSPMYFWMLPFPGFVRRRFEARRQDIYDGKITMDMDW